MNKTKPSPLPTMIITCVLIGLDACAHLDQPDGPSGRGPRPPQSPIVAVLDVNHDGAIDSNEVRNASTTMWTLDQNKDGRLDYDEMRPKGRREIAGPPPLIISTLDTNRDDFVQADEIANAPVVLWALDKNHDGIITLDEAVPPPPLPPSPFGDRPPPGKGPPPGQGFGPGQPPR